VASQSPAKDSEYTEYENGWFALTRLMDSGSSWSGKERNNAYLALADGTYVDVSAVAGVDFADDGRALATTDWDGDGAIDLWIKNRTGPQLRFLHNMVAQGRSHVTLALEGRSCNRDAIGAVVELRAGGRTYVKTVMGGEGYLAQSSSRLVFGLGDAEKIDGATVRWPGGDAQKLEGLSVNAAYRVVQGESPEQLAQRSVEFAGPEKPWPRRSAATRVVLRTPLPLPLTMGKELFGAVGTGRVQIVSLWAQWCSPCITELGDFARSSKTLHDAGVNVWALNVDAPADRETASHVWSAAVAPHMGEAPFEPEYRGTWVARLEVLLDHMFLQRGEGVLPTTLLVDKNGMVQVVYLGGTSSAQVLADAQDYGMHPEKPRNRTSFPGRWFFGIPRGLGELSAEFRRRGFEQEATFYSTIERFQRESGR
jgi:hypothetical protein